MLSVFHASHKGPVFIMKFIYIYIYMLSVFHASHKGPVLIMKHGYYRFENKFL